MQGRTIRRLYLLVSACVLALAVLALARGERIFAVAVSEVPLYDPASLAGAWGAPVRTVGALAAGSQAQVVACHDRKSSIDIQVEYNGAVAVLGGEPSQVKLYRTNAPLWDRGVTNSCRGLFTQAISELGG
jgi:hypothetical protein